MKIINFRYFFILALILLLVNIFLTAVLVSINLKIIFIIALLILIFISIFFAKKFKSKFCFVIASFLILSSLLSLNVLIRQFQINSLKTYNNREIVIQGRICSDSKFNDFGNINFSIDNITLIDGETARRTDGKIKVSISGYNVVAQKLQKGSYISFLGTIEINKYEIGEMGFLSNASFAKASLTGQEINFLDEFHLSFREKFQNFVYSKFNLASVRYSGIAFSMIFGKSYYIEDNIMDVFRNGGVSHLLAVSGLHISVILSFQLFILKRLKVKKSISLILNSILLGTYSYLCGFTISVLRASGMAILSMIADLRGKHYDRLSSLSFLFCVILLVNPTKMFSYSLILSFSTVLLITFFAKNLERFFDKFFKKRLSSSLSISISVMIGLSIIQLSLFKYFSILSLFSNLVCVPIATFAFNLTIVLVIISIILPFMTFSLKIFDYFMIIVIKFSSWISNLGLAFNFDGINMSIVVISIFVFLLASPYINKRAIIRKLRKK